MRPYLMEAAWMELCEIRSFVAPIIPDSATLHPDYSFKSILFLFHLRNVPNRPFSRRRGHGGISPERDGHRPFTVDRLPGFACKRKQSLHSHLNKSSSTGSDGHILTRIPQALVCQNGRCARDRSHHNFIF